MILQHLLVHPLHTDLHLRIPFTRRLSRISGVLVMLQHLLVHPLHTDPVHTSTVANSRSARDIVPIISLGQKTDALLDRLGIEDHFILHLRDLVGNV